MRRSSLRAWIGISRILFDPQPEPPGLPPGLLTQSISIMDQVSGVIERTTVAGLQEGTIPGLNALEQLSGHLVDAVVHAKSDKAAAQVNAMSQIAEQYAEWIITASNAADDPSDTLPTYVVFNDTVTFPINSSPN